MARSCLPKLYAALVAFIVGIAPQAGVAEFADADLSKLRTALRSIEADVKAGLDEPVDISAYWATLSLSVESSTNSAKTDAAFTSIATPAATVSTQPQEVDTTNFRLMLATLSQTYTGKNATAVVNAQGPRGPIAISVRAGTVTLADIRSYSTALGFPPLPDGTLTAPVVIWPGATLRIAPGERMALARDAGAFVLSMGTLDIKGAIIEGVGPENTHTPSFMPFVTVANGGSLIIENTRLKDLGFGQTAKFNGLSVAGNLLQQDTGKVVIKDNFFDNLNSLTVAGVTGAEVSGNTFINAGNNTLNLINAPKTTIRNNFFAGDPSSNSLYVDKGSSETRISRNMFVLGQRVAILIRGGSDRVKVHENLVWKRNGAALKFLQTRCGLVKDNIFLDNRQKGVEIRKSNGTVVNGNLIAWNRNAGIWVSAQDPDARTSLSANVLVSNGSGLSVATGAEIFMAGNDFSRQLPRLFEGDISHMTSNISVDLRGLMSLRMKDGFAEQGAEMTNLCGSVF